MDLNRILELLAKQMGNAASLEELNELEFLLEQHPNHQHLVSILKSIQSKKLKQPTQNEELIVKESWQKLQEKLKLINESDDENQGQRKMIVRNFFPPAMLKWAAVWIGAIGLTTIIYLMAVRPSHSTNILASVQTIIPHGKPGIKTLPDGSVVWINAGSKVRYEQGQNTRDVFLEGEAFFKVKHDAQHPFIVHAGNITVNALGTEFNVSAYPGEDYVETTLIEGRVQVIMDEKPDQKIILVPNEKLTVTSKQVSEINAKPRMEISYEVKPVEILPVGNEPGEVAWTQDRLAFQNEPFSELAKRIERRYNVHIVFYDERVKNETFSGVFENETIQKAMRVLQMTTPFQYKVKGDSIFINRP